MEVDLTVYADPQVCSESPPLSSPPPSPPPSPSTSTPPPSHQSSPLVYNAQKNRSSLPLERSYQQSTCSSEREGMVTAREPLTSQKLSSFVSRLRTGSCTASSSMKMHPPSTTHTHLCGARRVDSHGETKASNSVVEGSVMKEYLCPMCGMKLPQG